jgi:hypothetical protein
VPTAAVAAAADVVNELELNPGNPATATSRQDAPIYIAAFKGTKLLYRLKLIKSW